jgi:DEAD/DEAH box helicase domain-containing protein
MSDLGDFTTFLEQRFAKEIKSHTAVPATTGELVEFPNGLEPRLADTLRQQKIASLYSHQAEAFDAISAGDNTVLVANTASGKTLSFLLPILNSYLTASPPFSVLLLYPTKALSRDQEGTLGRLMETAKVQLKLGTFDGDTPRDERTRIQRTADFMITNPDMLHAGILPNHQRRWKNFLARLKYVVVDEVHMYRGAFGSHVANVFRRLQRVCELHGSSPTFVCSSATIGNPQAHVEALFGQPFSVIQKDGAPRPQRDLYMVNPPLVKSHGYMAYRKGPGSVSVQLIREAARRKIRTICFCRSRQQVERLHRAVLDRHPELRDQVKPYRGGLLPNERRKLERDLFEGRLNTIITTNALELGIDIGDLDLCLLSGHPGSVASFWQQAGRVGRKGKQAVIVYIAKDAPVDQYMVNHPEFISRAPIEQAWLNANNPYILMQHLPCAAHEYPLRDNEPLLTGPAYSAAVEVLKQAGTIKPWRDSFRYAERDYPARGVNLRGMTDYNVEIYCDSEVIGQIDPIGARGELYKDAIYQHLGRRYMSLDLDLDKKLCEVAEVDVDYYTEAVWEGRVEMTESFESYEVNGHRIDFGAVNINRQPKLYKKIRERTFENIGYGPITLEPFIYDTTGFCLLPADDWVGAMEKTDKRYISAALYGLSYILKRTAPSLCMGDIRDIETDVSLASDDDDFDSALFVFDSIEGGVGYAEKIADVAGEAFNLCRTIINECPCRSGCPSCITPLPPGVENVDLESLLIESNAAVVCTQSLLTSLIDGGVELPQIQVVELEGYPAINPPPVDEAALKLNTRLNRAAKVLKDKRERLH